MNESIPASPANQSESEPIRKLTLRGWRWFAVPVALNLFYLATLLTVFDGGFMSGATNYFSIPYLTTVAIIGLRRGARITVPDLLFLIFGNFFIIVFLWILKHPMPQWMIEMNATTTHPQTPGHNLGH